MSRRTDNVAFQSDALVLVSKVTWRADEEAQSPTRESVFHRVLRLVREIALDRLSRAPSAGMQLFVRSISGRTVTVAASDSETVRDIQHKLQASVRRRRWREDGAGRWRACRTKEPS